jgi:predicted ArsR family transcriptional regulator
MDTRSTIQLILQREPDLTIQEIADRLGISKMAVFKHIEFLENAGVLERKVEKGRVGRPFYRFRLSEANNSQLVNSDSFMLQALLDFLSDNGNEEILNSFLRDRQIKTIGRYMEFLRNSSGNDRLLKLASLRKSDNYFPELRQVDDSTSELLELNCPILKVAMRNGYACSLENEMFSRVLDADVESMHKKINGMGACKFIIRARKKNP